MPIPNQFLTLQIGCATIIIHKREISEEGFFFVGTSSPTNKAGT